MYVSEVNIFALPRDISLTSLTERSEVDDIRLISRGSAKIFTDETYIIPIMTWLYVEKIT